MPNYIFTNREGKEFEVNAEQELTQDQIRDIDMQINPARTADYFRGSVSSLSDFGHNIAETMHSVGNFVGGEIAKAVYGQEAADVPNPWGEMRDESRAFYEGDIPRHVQDSLSYKVLKAGTQLAPMIALSPLSAITLSSQGFAAGREDYLKTKGLTEATASREDLEMADAVGAAVAIPTVMLEKIGLGKLMNGLRGTGKATAARTVAEMMAVEGGTEALEQMASNLIASDVAGYDMERKWSEGVGESALIGGIVGGVPGTVRYAPHLIGETASGIRKVAETSADIATSSAASKYLQDAVVSGAAKGGDMATDLGVRAVNALVDRGIDVRPAVNGGKLLANGIVDAASKSTNYIKNAKDRFFETDVAQAVEKVIRPLNDYVASKSRRIGQVMMSFEHEAMKRRYDKTQAVMPAIRTMKRMKPADYKALHKHILQSNWSGVKSLFARYGDVSDWDAVGSMLKQMHQDFTDRGEQLGFLQDYFPRFVKDYKALARALGKPLEESQWEASVNAKQKTLGRELTPLEEAALFEDMIRAKRPTGVEAPKPSSVKERQLDVVGDDILQHYADPISALSIYINSMSDSITRLDYLGAMYDIVQADNDGVIDAESLDAVKKVGTKILPRDVLPKRLRGAKPKYRDSHINFASDVDKAAYIAASGKPSKMRTDFMKFAQRALGFTAAEVQEAGRMIRAEILKDLYARNPGGVLVVEPQWASQRQRKGVGPDTDTVTQDALPTKQIKQRRIGEFGRAFQEEKEAGRLTDADIDELHKLLGARFQKKSPMHNFIRGAKSLTHLAFLGSPLSTLTQIGDLAYSFHKNGIRRGLKSLGKSEWTLEDVYQVANDVAVEFSKDGEPGHMATLTEGLQSTISRVMTITGFRFADTKFKETFLNGTVDKWRETLKSPSSMKAKLLRQRFARLQGEQQAVDTISDIMAGRKTDGVAEMLLHELGEIAPMTQSDMPYLYNKYPNLRILYALKSYTLKQFNFARSEVFSKITSGDREQVREGFRNMFSLVTALALANGTADTIKAFITGDDWSIDDLVTDNLWRLLGLNSYSGVTLKREGLGSALESMTYKLPIVQVADNVSKDIFRFAPPLVSDKSKSVQYIPIAGRLIYKWQKNYGGEDDEE
jgi:hypothetical protein